MKQDMRKQHHGEFDYFISQAPPARIIPMYHRSSINMALCLAACALLCGCDAIKGPWYDPFLILTPHKEYTGNNDLVSADVSTLQPALAQKQPGIKMLRVQLVQLSLPVGTFSGNEKVWRQLDQDALDSDTSIMLAENGIRAAVAPVQRWPSLQKLINVPGAATQIFTLQTDGRSSVEIVTHPNIAEQTISSIDRDREMHVRTFERCDNSMRLSLVQRRDSSQLTIQLEPVVQLGTISVVRRPEDIGIVSNTLRHEETFSNLRLAASLGTHEFLVLAPAPANKENKFSVGSRFLTNTDKIPPMETILVFLPLNDSQAATAGHDKPAKTAGLTNGSTIGN